MKERQPMNFGEEHDEHKVMLSLAAAMVMLIILGGVIYAKEVEATERCISENAITQERDIIFNVFKPGPTYDLYPQCRKLLEIKKIFSGMPIGGW